jgi:C1A family cysteine protease
MKNVIIVLGICILFLAMPVGLSDCGCTLPDDATPKQSTQPWLSDADIAALQEQAKLEGWTFTIGKNSATNRSFSQLCGLVEPKDWWVNASFDPCVPTRELPTRFDWRELDGCTPVKDQDGCGSCWAFGTVGPLECNILIKDHKEVDLSEQWLVSCNQNGWGCDGGWWAHDYHQWKTDRFNGTGAVLEEEFPYEAADLPCDGPYDHPYLIDSWHYIGFSQGIPSTDAIKQAIITYGPVSAAVAVTDAFGAYTGGVFNQDDPHAQINHAPVLVGWDDSQGTNGVWILRNSWGPGWGEGGYMRIEYGCCKVGYGACYIVYPAKTKIEISGGFLGVAVGFRNVGNTETTEVKWNITLQGGILGGINQSVADLIPAIQPGEVVYERFPRLGFGHVSIAVTAVPKNAGKMTMHADGFLCGLLLFVPQNQ